MAKLLLGIILATSFLLFGIANEVPQIELLANILTYFKTAELCSHVADVFIWIDDYGKWDIRFKTPIAPEEDGEQLCQCMYDYINQNNWLGANCKHVCIIGSNCVTLVLEGPSSPNYDPSKPPVIKPISTLCSILKNFKTAELGNTSCKSKCKPEGKLTRLELQCELSCDSPSPIYTRDKALNYLNQSGLLEGATVTTKADGKSVVVIITGA